MKNWVKQKNEQCYIRQPGYSLIPVFKIWGRFHRGGRYEEAKTF